MSDLLAIGASGVRAYQTALATVGENIANVGSTGYTRRTVQVTEVPGGSGTVNQYGAGNGVNLTGIVRARRLSRATMRNIRQNLVLAFAYNAAGVPIAAGVLYPVSGILLSPVIAAAAMALSSVSVVGNALRLRAAKVG